MSSSLDTRDPNHEELIAGRIIGDLSDDERRTLEENWAPESDRSAHELELTAAALMLALRKPDENLPIALRSRIAADATNHLGDHALSMTGETQIVSDTEHSPFLETPAKTLTRREMLAWCSLAASLLLAVGLWLTQPGTPEKLTASVSRDTLLAKDEGLLRVDWAAGKTPFATAVSGDVVWSTRLQEGYMRFVGMPVNDPTVEQYQLWIIDPQRDDEPVDGGVFDISSERETIIPIDAKLAVIKPAAFAITIEKPGGVVVSDQSRLPLLAAVD